MSRERPSGSLPTRGVKRQRRCPRQYASVGDGGIHALGVALVFDGPPPGWVRGAARPARHRQEPANLHHSRWRCIMAWLTGQRPLDSRGIALRALVVAAAGTAGSIAVYVGTSAWGAVTVRDTSGASLRGVVIVVSGTMVLLCAILAVVAGVTYSVVVFGSEGRQGHGDPDGDGARRRARPDPLFRPTPSPHLGGSCAEGSAVADLGQAVVVPVAGASVPGSLRSLIGGGCNPTRKRIKRSPATEGPLPRIALH